MDPLLLTLLERLTTAVERLAGPADRAPPLPDTDAAIWHPARPGHPARLEPVPTVAAPDLVLLRGIDAQKRILRDNTARFAAGMPANNAMLWGARGTGKSSLVKAVHRDVNLERPDGSETAMLVEIARDDLTTLPDLLFLLQKESRRFIVFCDDLSFEREDADYKALKSVLDGGLRGRPANVLFYATSNRRHLMPREMVENERSTAINPTEAVEEKISLSDRFGLWIGFHGIDQPTYLAMIEGYLAARGLAVPAERWRPQALAWATGRGARSGRVAAQFVDDLEGRERYRNAGSINASPPI